MATQFVDEPGTSLEPGHCRDTLKDRVIAWVDKKAKAGDTEAVFEADEESPGWGADIINPTELLQQSLRGHIVGGKKGRASRRGGGTAVEVASGVEGHAEATIGAPKMRRVDHNHVSVTAARRFAEPGWG